MTWRWFISGAIRQASDLRRHVLKILSAQRDLLPPQAITPIETAADQLHAAIQGGADRAALKEKMNQLEEAANKWLQPYPNAAWRENVEVLLVAVAIAMAIRTFFLQPMKIPTGSMQPTLYGITSEDLRQKPEVKLPTGLVRFYEACFLGNSYYHAVAKSDGRLEIVDSRPRMVLPFVYQQRLRVGSDAYTVWFPGEDFLSRAGLQNGQLFRQGEDIYRLRVTAGDHLFVNRLVYNFRRPERGEIVIFETKGIEALAQDTFYIKRLVGLGGDKVRIGNDQHLVINGCRLDAATPHFENVYTFGPQPRPYQYFGHVNMQTYQKFLPGGPFRTLPAFVDDKGEFTVGPNHFLVMGDNTMNSSDSRCWGDFPREKVIGRSSFVYWPISSRFGWGQE